MPILKKKKASTKRELPKPKKLTDDICSFPDPKGTETRTFRKGEIVCMRYSADKIKAATYVRPVGDRHLVVFGKGVASVEEHWSNIGTFKSKSDPVVLSHIAAQKNLPEDIERLMKAYGGKTRRRRLTSRA